jgi:hypothetical protein
VEKRTPAAEPLATCNINLMRGAPAAERKKRRLEMMYWSVIHADAMLRSAETRAPASPAHFRVIAARPLKMSKSRATRADFRPRGRRSGDLHYL